MSMLLQPNSPVKHTKIISFSFLDCKTLSETKYSFSTWESLLSSPQQSSINTEKKEHNNKRTERWKNRVTTPQNVFFYLCWYICNLLQKDHLRPLHQLQRNSEYYYHKQSILYQIWFIYNRISNHRFVWWEFHWCYTENDSSCSIWSESSL